MADTKNTPAPDKGLASKPMVTTPSAGKPVQANAPSISITPPATPTPTPSLGKPVAPSQGKPATTPPAQTAPTQAKPSAAPVPAPGTSEKSIFSTGKTFEAKDSKMMKSILQQKGPSGSMPGIKPILGKSQELKATIEADRAAKQKRKYRVTVFIFVFVALAMGALNGFLFSQITPDFDLFGANLMSNINELNKNLMSQQTQINKFRHLSAQIDLNSFSYAADEYWDLTTKLTDNNLTAPQIKDASQRINFLIDRMPELLSRLKTHMGNSLIVETYNPNGQTDPVAEKQSFIEGLKEALNKDKKEITDAGGNESEIKLVSNAVSLAGNSKVLSTVTGTDVEKFKTTLRTYSQDTSNAEAKNELETIINGILGTTKSEIAVIGTLKKQRLEWSKIIKRLETVSAELELGRGQDAKINMDPTLVEIKPASLFYTGYQLDSKSGSISLSGLISTSDATNFYLISRLIDILKEDPYFKDIDLRAFSKAGRQGEGYSSNFSFNVELDLQAIEENDRRVSLIKRILAIKEGRKRN